MNVRPSAERLVQDCPRLPNRLARSIRLSFLLVLPLLTVAWALSGCGGSNKAEERYNAGVELQDQGLLEEAIAEYDEAISIDADFVEAYRSRGAAYALLNQDQQAIEDYDEAIKLTPRLSQPSIDQGFAYGELGDDPRADDRTADSIIRDFDLAMIHMSRGDAYKELGRAEIAVDNYSRAIALSPRLAVAYANRAIAYTLLNQDSRADQDVTRAIALGYDPEGLIATIEELINQR